MFPNKLITFLEKNALQRISQQTHQIILLEKDNQQLREDNESMKELLENELNNIQNYMISSSKNRKNEQENIDLKKRIDQTISVTILTDLSNESKMNRIIKRE